MNEKKKRGFATMSPERVKEIASQGGRNAHASGNAHKFSGELARTAGSKGGKVSQSRRKVQAANEEPSPADFV